MFRSAATALLILTAFAAINSAQAVIPDKAFEMRAAELRTKLKGRGFSVVVERPFVVIGDEEPGTVAIWANDIIRATVSRLKQEYFAKDPASVLEVWLFKDDASYRRHAKEFFGDEPDTPFGFYSPSDKALIMNISTGGGTLVHEMVHPFIEANFPESPPWFNEGLGSLYEYSGVVAGRIHGFPNWRLPGLQRAIRQRGVPSFAALTAMGPAEFYRDDSGTNYASARYLCYYLQDRGLLNKFYKEFTANVKTDPTGYKTLQRVLGERSMASFQKRWDKFVLALTY